MATIDNLETLSNAELRLKCIEHGLPNVPVTDSSRKLLIKRLRDSMRDTTSKDISSKSSNRRETIHVSKTAPPAENANEPLSLSQATKNRRTIAATAPVISKDDATVAAPTSIPISTRRRSVQKEAEPKPVKAASKAKATILIEDDEEDIDLVTALENAEKESTTSSVPIETIPTRRKSRSVSVPKVVNEVVATVSKKRAMTPLVEEQIENQKKETTKPKTQNITKSNDNAASQKSYQPTISSLSTTFTQPSPKTPIDMTGNWYGVYDQKEKIPCSQPVQKTSYENSAGRYSMHTNTSTVYSSPVMRYSVGDFGSNLPNYRTKYSANDILNEQSDTDINNDDGSKSPFLSNFARNLERSKSVGRTSGGSSGHYKRHSGTNYDSIRGRRIQNDISLRQMIIGLNRRYKLINIIVLFVLLFISIFLFVRLSAS